MNGADDSAPFVPLVAGWSCGGPPRRSRCGSAWTTLPTTSPFPVPRSCYNPAQDSHPACAGHVAVPGLPDAGRERETNPVYKLLLCVRYLQTRYLAFICIVSVMLGVATLIVVNAVMSGFSTKLKDRLHGVLSDVVIDTDRMDGFVKYDDQGRPIFDHNGQVVAVAARDDRRMIEDQPGRRQDRGDHARPSRCSRSCSSTSSGQRSVASRSRLIGIDPHEPRQRRRVLRIPRPPERARRTRTSTSRPRRSSSTSRTSGCARRPGNRARRRSRRPLVPDPTRSPSRTTDVDEGRHARRRSCTASSPATRIAHFRFRDEHGRGGRGGVLKPGDDVTITTVGGGETQAGLGHASSSPTTSRPR